MDGCDFNDVVPLVGIDERGVEADGVKRTPLLDPEMVAECWVDKPGLLSLLDPAEYVVDGDFGLKNVLPLPKLNPPPPLRFLPDGEGDTGPGSSPNSDSDIGNPLMLDEALSCEAFAGVVPDGFRKTLRR
jgi:hypothetical protein